MVYGIIGMINFAHGEIYMIGTYVAFLAITAMGILGIDYLPVVFCSHCFPNVLVSKTPLAGLERIAYRPLRGSNQLIPSFRPSACRSF